MSEEDTIKKILSEDSFFASRFFSELRHAIGDKLTLKDFDDLRQSCIRLVDGLLCENNSLRHALRHYGRTYEEGFIDAIDLIKKDMPEFSHIVQEHIDYNNQKSFRVVPRDTILFNVFEENWKIKKLREILKGKDEASALTSGEKWVV